MTVWRQGLTRAEPDNPNVGLRTLDEWLRDQSIAVVPRCFAQPDDVHNHSIARRDPAPHASPGSTPTGQHDHSPDRQPRTSTIPAELQLGQHVGCLLYTSDAA